MVLEWLQHLTSGLRINERECIAALLAIATFADVNNTHHIYVPRLGIMSSKMDT